MILCGYEITSDRHCVQLGNRRRFFFHWNKTHVMSNRLNPLKKNDQGIPMNFLRILPAIPDLQMRVFQWQLPCVDKSHICDAYSFSHQYMRIWVTRPNNGLSRGIISLSIKQGGFTRGFVYLCSKMTEGRGCKSISLCSANSSVLNCFPFWQENSTKIRGNSLLFDGLAGVWGDQKGFLPLPLFCHDH